MVGLKHWIITRYNVGLYHINGMEYAEEWMRHRYRLFATYTVPSLMNQSCPNFTWLMIFDSYTPVSWLKNIERLCSGLNIQIEVLDWDVGSKKYGERRSCGGPIADVIRNAILEVPCEKRLQTRMDNDDVYNPILIEHLQKRVSRNTGEKTRRRVYDYAYGYVYDSIRNTAYIAEHAKASPWISLFTKSPKNRETVYDRHHRGYIGKDLIQNRPSFNAWMMVLHDRNVSNRLFENMSPTQVDVEKMRREMCL